MTKTKRGNGEGSTYQRGDGKWVTTAHDADGKRVYFYGKTRRESVEKARAAADRLADAANVVDAKTKLATYIEHWIRTALAHSDRKEATRNLYAALLRKHVVPALGNKSLAALKPSDLTAALAGLDLSASSRRSVYAALRAVLDAAVDDRLLRVNPMTKVKRPRVEHTEAAVLDATQVRAFLAVATEDRLAALWHVLAFTGCRRGEALALRWDDWNENAGTLHVRRTLTRVDGSGVVESEPKTARSRRLLDVPDPLAAVLRTHRARQAEERLRVGAAWQNTVGRMFTSESGGPLDPRGINRRFESLRAKAELPPCSPHVLRHSLATALLQAGTPVQVVADQLGHSSSVVTLSTYSHALPTARKAAADLAASLFAGE